MLSEYEQQRLDRIESNKRKLVELGLDDHPLLPSGKTIKVVKKVKKAGKSVKKAAGKAKGKVKKAAGKATKAAGKAAKKVGAAAKKVAEEKLKAIRAGLMKAFKKMKAFCLEESGKLTPSRRLRTW